MLPATSRDRVVPPAGAPAREGARPQGGIKGEVVGIGRLRRLSPIGDRQQRTGRPIAPCAQRPRAVAVIGAGLSGLDRQGDLAKLARLLPGEAPCGRRCPDVRHPRSSVCPRHRPARGRGLKLSCVTRDQHGHRYKATIDERMNEAVSPVWESSPYAGLPRFLAGELRREPERRVYPPTSTSDRVNLMKAYRRGFPNAHHEECLLRR